MAVVKPMSTSKVKTVKKDQKEEKNLPISPTRNYNKKHGIKCNCPRPSIKYICKWSLIVSAKVNARASVKSSPTKSLKKNESSIDPAKRGRMLSIVKDWKSRASGGGSDEHHSCNHAHGDECKVDPALEEDVYDGLDASVTLLIHGLESDWIEEEMSDDDDFK